MSENTAKQMSRLNSLLSETEAVYRRAALKLGVSDSIMQVLYAACICGGECPISYIVSSSGIKKQTVNSALRKLEQSGHVFLRSSQGKSKTVCLTAGGKVLAEKTAGRIIEIEGEIYEGWSASEREEYIRLTEKYLISLKERVNKEL